jgi:hypothetical protein
MSYSFGLIYLKKVDDGEGPSFSRKYSHPFGICGGNADTEQVHRISLQRPLAWNAPIYLVLLFALEQSQSTWFQGKQKRGAVSHICP